MAANIECVLNQIARYAPVSSFPLITYKVGAIAAWALHIYGLSHQSFSRDEIVAAVVIEAFTLYYVYILNKFLSVDKAYYVALMQEQNVFNLIKNIKKDVTLISFAGTYLINSFRLLSSGIMLYDVYDKIRYKPLNQIKEKDVVLLLGYSLLASLSIWAVFKSFEFKDKSPNLLFCFENK